MPETQKSTEPNNFTYTRLPTFSSRKIFGLCTGTPFIRHTGLDLLGENGYNKHANIFFELADNGLSGCSEVVVINTRKWGHFGALGARHGALWLAGRTGPKASDRSEASIISRANDKCNVTKQPIVAIRCPLDRRTGCRAMENGL